MNSILFAPHADDEALFASHILLSRRPRVVICYGSERDYGPTEVRTEESRRAVAILGAGPVTQWDGGDLVAQMRALDAALAPDSVFAPGLPSSHRDHVAVAEAAAEVFGERLIRYYTYEGGAKVRLGRRVELVGDYARLKREALSCYETQRTHPRANVFYDESAFDLDEYADPPAIAASDPAAIAEAERGVASARELLQRGVMAESEARAREEEDSEDVSSSTLPGEVTSQPTPAVATREGAGGKKRKGGKDRR